MSCSAWVIYLFILDFWQAVMQCTKAIFFFCCTHCNLFSYRQRKRTEDCNVRSGQRRQDNNFVSAENGGGCQNHSNHRYAFSQMRLRCASSPHPCCPNRNVRAFLVFFKYNRFQRRDSEQKEYHIFCLGRWWAGSGRYSLLPYPYDIVIRRLR